MMRDADDEGDYAIVPHFGLDDVDPTTLQRYRMAFALRNNSHPFSDLADVDFLIQLGAYRKDRSTGEKGLTFAGLMMFGKGLSIREYLPNFRMDYVNTMGISLDNGEKYADRLTYDGRWENNLYNFITGVFQRISLTLPSPGVVRGVVRDDDNPVMKAVREAVTNSIIHCQLREDGVLRIDRTGNEIILRNPGNLKISPKRIYEGGYTKARNPKIQDMLRMIGLGDNIGSGFPLILKTWRDESWLKPEILEEDDVKEVRLTLSMVSVLAPGIIDELHKLYGKDFDALTPEEKECIILIAGEHCDSNSTIQASTGKNGWEVNKTLSSLQTKGMLIGNGNGRWTKYEINRNYIPTTQNSSDADSDLQKLYDLIKAQPGLNTQSLSDICEWSRRKTERLIARLKSGGLIYFVGPKRTGGYQAVASFNLP